MRKLGRTRRLLLDLVPALMLGGAVGFLAFVAPLELLERLVVRSHLAVLVSQARPPLGMTARALVAGGLGGVATVAAFGAALAVGRVGRRRGGAAVAVPDFVPATAPAATPVLRRADRHPDAPVKRPLFARDELGASFDALPGVEPATSAPVVEPAVSPTPAPQGSVADLLARLERSVAVREPETRRAANG